MHGARRSMLKKIPTSQLQVGMHVQALCGRWTEHPFWRSKFLVKDADMLRQLVDSGVQEVWIDTSKGVAPPAPPRVPPPPATAAPAVAAAPAAPRATVPPQPRPPVAVADVRAMPPIAARVPMHDEVQRAAGVCHRGRQAVMSMFNEARMGRALDARGCLPLVEDIAGSVSRNPGAVISLARLKTHDDYSYMHSVAACALMVALSRQLGHDEEQQRVAGLAGLLHDIGKASMPLEVLNKADKLTDAEFRLMREHPQKGFDLLREVGTAGDAVMDVVLHHHERMDGKGYPHNLAGEQIALLARMGAVCDVYDAVTSNRPYKAAWDPSEALARMASWAPAHFDPHVFQNFVKALGIYPIGSLVRLQSGRLAVVVEQNPTALMLPVVRVFFSTKSNLHVSPELVDLSAKGCPDRIAARESNKNWNFGHLDELWAGRDVLRKIGH